MYVPANHSASFTYSIARGLSIVCADIALDFPYSNQSFPAAEGSAKIAPNDYGPLFELRIRAMQFVKVF